MAYEKYYIYQFMDAWFNKKYDELSEDDFKLVRAEYMDTSGLYMSEDFEKQGYICNLSQRLNYVKLFCKLQRDFIRDFAKPFIRDFELIKDRYGHSFKWREDLLDFEKQLKRCENREKKFESELRAKIKELSDLRKSNEKNLTPIEDDEALKKSRISFIRMLNSLGKIGYKIDRRTTFVEELALMIKQQMEDVENQRSQYGR